jgi:hypothetical protein
MQTERQERAHLIGGNGLRELKGVQLIQSLRHFPTVPLDALVEGRSGILLDGAVEDIIDALSDQNDSR